MKKPSITEIATSLGVSKTLVSMVLNDKGTEHGISLQTQQKVLRKAQEINYKHRGEKKTTDEKTSTIGLIVADISNPFYAKIAQSIEHSAAKVGYNLIICSSDESEEKEIKLLKMLKRRHTDGLIISSTLSDYNEILMLKRENFPFVLIDRYFPRVDTNYVVVDNYQGAYEAVEHLLKIGYTKIAQLSISPSHITSLKDRTQGYRDALNKHGFRYEKKLDREIPFGDIKTNVYNELKKILESPDDVQALFVANNNLAVACLECLNDMKLMMPRDLAIVSFDDIPLFAYTYSPITAVAQPVEDICRESVKLLVNDINNSGKALKQHIVLPPRLMIRHSCGRLSGRINK